ncbi:hypothetical protein R1sor_004903 [Riccia sorocarpa]|uniref:Uncharacterized protein n=1 Tax=Riccia sorocarpa TaxID=122646 RepID=A0ABD3HKZ0_9MARC
MNYSLAHCSFPLWWWTACLKSATVALLRTVGGMKMDRDGHGYEDGRGPVIMQCPCSSVTISSSSNNEMRPRAMARAVGSQKSAVRHRMTKHDYELMISYLEVPENFNGITGGGRKTKVGGKNFTKTTVFGHMAVSLYAQGFPKCNGGIMGKKKQHLPRDV